MSSTLRWCKVVQALLYGLPKVRDGPLRATQEALQLREGPLYGVEVGRVGQELEEPCSHRLDVLPDAADLVGRQVVHDDRVARLEGRGEDVGHVGAEGLPVHRAIKQPGCGDAARAQAGCDGRGFPMMGWTPRRHRRARMVVLRTTGGRRP